MEILYKITFLGGIHIIIDIGWTFFNGHFLVAPLYGGKQIKNSWKYY